MHNPFLKFTQFVLGILYKSNRMTDNLRLIDAFVEKVNIVSFLKLLIFMPVKRTV